MKLLLIVIVGSELSAPNSTRNKGQVIFLYVCSLFVNKKNTTCVLKCRPPVFTKLIELKYPAWNI